MLDHLSLGAHDLDRSTAFYQRVLATIGYQLHRRESGEVAFGPAEAWTFFLYPIDPARSVAAAGSHVAFRARDRGAVRRFYAAALEAGGSPVPDRAPAERSQFGADYFGAVLSDPDGHAVEVMTRAPEAVAG
jgi:catechol 2,3-dioxygenase-like lactoylglutathione lyase family enzyme